VVMFLLCIEVLHLWQIGRSGSITRPALALLLGWLMKVMGNEQGTSAAKQERA